jgi:hypothetical protein
MAFCARAEKTCQVDYVRLKQMRCIRWSRFDREEKSGSGDMQQSLAIKGPFSALPGKFTKKTLARVYYQVFSGRRRRARDLQILVVPLQKLVTIEIAPVHPFSISEFWASQVRVRHSTSLLTRDQLTIN